METKSFKLKLVQEFEEFNLNGSISSKISKMKNLKRQHTSLKMQMDDIFYCYKLFQSLDVAVQQQYNYLLTSKDELSLEAFCNAFAALGSILNPMVINHSEKNTKKNVYCKTRIVTS